jgi:hypothetical protein
MFSETVVWKREDISLRIELEVSLEQYGEIIQERGTSVHTWYPFN